VLVGIVLLAFNLRPAAVAVAPVLGELRTDLEMSAAQAGLLTSLPVLAFAGFGALAPRLARAVGPHRLTVLALLGVVAGQLSRAVVDIVPTFLACSLVSLAGMATANVVLPSLVKQHFPDRIGVLTALYSTTSAIGLTLTSALTVPISEASGSWRYGLAAWALTAVIALLPWLALMGQDRREPISPQAAEGFRITLAAVARTALGWQMVVFFGLQALQAYAIFGWFAVIYRDAGFSPATAGLLLGLVTGISVPFSLLVPWLAARMANPAPLLVALVSCYPFGYLGLMLAPTVAPWLWAGVVGIGTTTFPLILTLIGLRARTPAGTAALSGFTQSLGYLIAALGPFGMGLVHDLTGGWDVPLLLLTVLTVPLLLVGLAVARPTSVEDQLRTPAVR
jgi:MFS transporter, CP family, cyanate transporter